MTNDATRANAQVLPDRRRFLINSGAAAAGLAASVAIPADAKADDEGELDRLIEAHRTAYVRFDAAVEVSDLTPPKMEIFVPLSIGGAQSAYASDDLRDTADSLRRDIAKRYKEAEKGLYPIHKLRGDLLGNVEAALRKGQADDLRAMRRLVRAEYDRREATGYNAKIRDREEASDAERDAFDALLSYPCRSMSAVARKASAILGIMDETGCWLEEEQVELLLSSMKGGEA